MGIVSFSNPGWCPKFGREKAEGEEGRESRKEASIVS